MKKILKKDKEKKYESIVSALNDLRKFKKRAKNFEILSKILLKQINYQSNHNDNDAIDSSIMEINSLDGIPNKISANFPIINDLEMPLTKTATEIKLFTQMII